MVTSAPHPLVAAAPGGLCWKRSDRRRPGRGAEAHQELVVFLGLSGQADYLLDGVVHELRRGSVLWAFAGQAHVLLSDSDDFDMWVLLISDRVLDDAAPFPPLRLPETGSVPPRRINENAINELSKVAEAAKTAETPEARKTALRWWLLRAWTLWNAADGLEGRRVHPAVDRAARLLRSDPEMSIKEVSGEAGLSPGRLGKVFRAETGTGLAEFRTEQRLNRVDQLMRDTRTTLTSAALDAGFGSYSQFYRVFQSRRSKNPRDYYRDT